MPRSSRISSRVAISFAVAAITLELLASLMYGAAGSSTGLSVEPSNLLASGHEGASLIRWGSLIDMFGYLSIAPVVLYLRDRYASARYVGLFAAAGLAVVVIGSIGAASMATAAPPMIDDYVSASPPQRQALLPAFATLYRAVVLGLKREGPRSVLVILLVLGVVVGAIAVYRLVAAG